MTAAIEREDFDCPVCHELLFEPCVPPCGHAFCRGCLGRLLHHVQGNVGSRGAKCPVCRRVLHVTRAEDLAVCAQFSHLLRSVFPNAYCAREEERLARMDTADDSLPWLPLFILDATLPRQHLQLNVFEARYVNMVRHVLQGSRTFGMVGRSAGQRMHHDFGVEVLLESAQEQWDGRFLVEIVGRRPFRICDARTVEHGLVEAHVEYLDFDDTADEDDIAVEQAASELLSLVPQWERLIETGGWERLPGHLALIREHLGPAPSADQPGSLAAWVVAYFNPMPALGVAPECRPALLAASTPLQRLAVAREGLQASLAHLQRWDRWSSLTRWLPKRVQRFAPLLVLGLAVVLARLFSERPVSIQ